MKGAPGGVSVVPVRCWHLVKMRLQLMCDMCDSELPDQGQGPWLGYVGGRKLGGSRWHPSRPVVVQVWCSARGVPRRAAVVRCRAGTALLRLVRGLPRLAQAAGHCKGRHHVLLCRRMRWSLHVSHSRRGCSQGLMLAEHGTCGLVSARDQ